jgi:hypothetical protein
MNQTELPSAEREDLKQKIKEILVELQADSFKNEVLKELKEASKKKESSPLQHPAFLLLLGFILTGVVGTWLTSFWQSREQEKQRQQLAHEHALEQKYDVIDQINKAAAEADTGAQVMVYLLIYGEGEKREKVITERETYWSKARRNWLVNSQVLEQKLAINFKNDEALALYQSIKEESNETTYLINDTYEQLKSSSWTNPEKDKVIDIRLQAISQIKSIQSKTKQLLKILVEEINKEETEP